MSKIKILATLSIDGFYVPLDSQRLLGFNTPEYEELCQDAEGILINSSGYKELQGMELSLGKSVYKIKRDRLLQSSDNKFLSFSELTKKVNELIIIAGNNQRLLNYLIGQSLVKELVVCVFPVILGRGKRLFPPLSDKIIWKVTKRQIFDSGITTIYYKYNK